MFRMCDKRYGIWFWERIELKKNSNKKLLNIVL